MNDAEDKKAGQSRQFEMISRLMMVEV